MSNPKLIVHNLDDVTVVSFREETLLDELQIRLLGDEVLFLVDQSGQRDMIVDFDQVRSMSSALLGVLIRVHKRMREQDRRLVLCGLGEQFREVFQITGLDRVFTFHKDPGDAAEGLRGGSEHGSS
jgi:anti-sigma B factor antagonist